MRIRHWRASVYARQHMLQKHNVEWHQVQEAVASAPELRRGPDRRGERRYYVEGRSVAGRPLTVIFRIEGDTARVITAYEED